MTILGDIGNWFTKAGNSIYKSVLQPIGNGISKAATSIYNSVLKPAYENIIKPVGEASVSFVKTTIASGEKIVSGTADSAIAFQKAGSSAVGGLGGFLSNPMSYLLIGVGAIIILPKILDKV